MLVCGADQRVPRRRRVAADGLNTVGIGGMDDGVGLRSPASGRQDDGVDLRSRASGRQDGGGGLKNPGCGGKDDRGGLTRRIADALGSLEAGVDSGGSIRGARARVIIGSRAAISFPRALKTAQAGGVFRHSGI